MQRWQQPFPHWDRRPGHVLAQTPVGAPRGEGKSWEEPRGRETPLEGPEDTPASSDVWAQLTALLLRGPGTCAGAPGHAPLVPSRGAASPSPPETQTCEGPHSAGGAQEPAEEGSGPSPGRLALGATAPDGHGQGGGRQPHGPGRDGERVGHSRFSSGACVPRAGSTQDGGRAPGRGVAAGPSGRPEPRRPPALLLGLWEREGRPRSQSFKGQKHLNKHSQSSTRARPHLP